MKRDDLYGGDSHLRMCGSGQIYSAQEVNAKSEASCPICALEKQIQEVTKVVRVGWVKNDLEDEEPEEENDKTDVNEHGSWLTEGEVLDWTCESGHIYRGDPETECPHCEAESTLNDEIISVEGRLLTKIDDVVVALRGEQRAVAREVFDRISKVEDKSDEPKNYYELKFNNLLEAAAWAVEKGYVMVSITYKNGEYVARRK